MGTADVMDFLFAVFYGIVYFYTRAGQDQLRRCADLHIKESLIAEEHVGVNGRIFHIPAFIVIDRMMGKNWSRDRILSR